MLDVLMTRHWRFVAALLGLLDIKLVRNRGFQFSVENSQTDSDGLGHERLNKRGNECSDNDEDECTHSSKVSRLKDTSIS